jgi:hypothetical protein
VSPTVKGAAHRAQDVPSSGNAGSQSSQKSCSGGIVRAHSGQATGSSHAHIRRIRLLKLTEIRGIEAKQYDPFR